MDVNWPDLKGSSTPPRHHLQSHPNMKYTPDWWLSQPLWRIWICQLRWWWWNSQLNGNIKNVPNHQPAKVWLHPFLWHHICQHGCRGVLDSQWICAWYPGRLTIDYPTIMAYPIISSWILSKNVEHSIQSISPWFPLIN